MSRYISIPCINCGNYYWCIEEFNVEGINIKIHRCCNCCFILKITFECIYCNTYNDINDLDIIRGVCKKCGRTLISSTPMNFITKLQEIVRKIEREKKSYKE